MSKVLNLAHDHPELGLVGVCPPSPNSSRGSAGYQERILALNREFQVGPLIFDKSRARNDSTADAEDGAVENSVAGPFLPPDNPGPSTVGGGLDPFTTLVEMGDVRFVEPTRFYKMNFDPSRLRLAHGGGGVQLLVPVDSDTELEVEDIHSTLTGYRAVGIQVQPRVSERNTQYDVTDTKNPDDDDQDSPSSDSTVSSGALQLEQREIVAYNELTK